MLKMIIADDEQFILEGLMESIDWKSFGIEVVGGALNGVEALNMTIELKPNIILTDIKMPGLNGLELVKEIKKLRSDIKIILLSAYEQFEYAQEAITLGVMSYITKPLKRQIVIDEVIKAKEKIIEERLEKESKSKYEELYLSNLPILKEHFLNNIILGKTRLVGDYSNQFSNYGIEIDESSVAVLVFLIDNIEKTTGELNDKNTQIVLIRISEMIRENIPKEYRYTIFHSYNNEVVTIFNAPNGNNTAIKDIAKTAEIIKNTMMRGSNISVSAGIGRVYSSPQNIMLSYQEAVKALNFRLVYGYNTVLYIDSVELKEVSNFDFLSDLNELLSNIQNILWIGKADEIEKMLEERLSEIIINKNIPGYYIQQIFCHLLSALLRTTYEMNILPEQLYGMPVHLYGELLKKQSVEEMKKWYYDLVKRVCTIINDKKSIRLSHVINSAVEYIRAHSFKDISLSEVAEYVNLNPSYLSRLFKAEIGIQFVDYVRNVKMDMAKNLLKKSNKKIYEICEELGYQNVQYFSTVFKNYSGMTPLEFKKHG